jgi:hypothetical protein
LDCGVFCGRGCQLTFFLIVIIFILLAGMSGRR